MPTAWTEKSAPPASYVEKQADTSVIAGPSVDYIFGDYVITEPSTILVTTTWSEKTTAASSYTEKTGTAPTWTERSG